VIPESWVSRLLRDPVLVKMAISPLSAPMTASCFPSPLTSMPEACDSDPEWSQPFGFSPSPLPARERRIPVVLYIATLADWQGLRLLGDFELSQRLSDLATERARTKFSWHAAQKKHLKVYNKLLA
jgi:hypothetical protein